MGEPMCMCEVFVDFVFVFVCKVCVRLCKPALDDLLSSPRGLSKNKGKCLSLRGCVNICVHVCVCMCTLLTTISSSLLGW